jgi:DNA-3-methyladenine glycosylase
VSAGTARDPRTPRFYDRSVHDVARDLLGCIVRHGGTAGRIVETESYHETEAACHAHVGLTERTRPLLGPPGVAYVYRSYGLHALLNAVAERDGVGAAVLIRALEPLEGLAQMRTRRGLDRSRDLCSGPGKLTQALGIDIELNRSSLTHGPIDIEPRTRAGKPRPIVTGPRIGITKAADLPWRFCDAGAVAYLSRPLPPAMRRELARPRRAPGLPTGVSSR